MTDSELARFKAERAAIVARMNLRTVSQYLADTTHLVDSDPKAGTDWEGR